MLDLLEKMGMSGASAAEYAMIIALIGATVAIAVTALGKTMSDTLLSFASHIN